MYENFYALRENPFNITSDPEYFFRATRHAQALSNLIYGIEHRKGILLVTGEVGTGKTTLCRTLLQKLHPPIKTALILNPSFSDLQLLRLIVSDLGLQTKARNKFDLIQTLNAFLLKETRLGHNVILIIDEAQNLGVKQLEQIRLLSNLETTKEKLLQIVLVGQPELNEKLKLNELRQLNQRIAVRYHISPFTPRELGDYIHHRISVASLDPQNPRPRFTDKAIQTIYAHSHGVARTVNILCDRRLLAGYVQEVYTINEKILYRCVEEVAIS